MMSSKKKTLCKWKGKQIRDNIEKYYTFVRDSNFVCGKCGRVSNDKKHLCKPIEFHKT